MYKYLLGAKKHMHEVVIVGAGPVGLYTARMLEKKLDVLVLDKKQEIGLPVQCSGLYSSNLKNFIPIKKDFLEHKVTGAILHSPSVELKLEKPSTAAFVVNRERLDKHLASQVKSTVVLGESAKGIGIKKDRAIVTTSKRTLETEVLIGCDGPASVVRNHFKEQPHEMISGLVATVSERNEGQYVELWFHAEKVPGGFFWKIPRGKTTEYGVFAKNAHFSQLEEFFNLEKGYQKNAGAIPFGPPKTYFERCLLIGDAAAQVKPWSGGGVMYGLTCARIAADVVFKAFEAKDFSETFLKQYETRWKSVLGRNMTLGMVFRDFLAHATNKDLDRFFSRLKEADMNQLDMDFPEWGFEL
jgi:digeranylgeranylglycerophospholipid reductase